MKFDELAILLPCHSLEDFPMHHDGEEADGLLAAWTALWHPALVAAAGSVVTWYRAEDPPEELQNKLLVIPEVSEELLMVGWAARAGREGACVVRKQVRREAILEPALAALDERPEVDPELAADFMALGLAYLHIELLTRQMRYMSVLDETHIGNETVAAAQAAVAGDEEKARERLRHCFDLLAEARQRFYGVDSYLVDLTLVAETTIGESLRDALASPDPTNLLLPGEVLERMAEQEPETLRALKAAVEEKRVTVVGGEYTERELPLLPMESVLASLRHGEEVYRRHLGRPPRLFARRRHGLCTILPMVLTRMGYTGALHFTLDDGHFPRGEQSKTRWEGCDGSTIDCLARVPLDATDAGALLNFPERMGEAMDMDHVATIAFAHWPGRTSPWYDDLRRVARHDPLLGKFVTLDEYFTDTEHSGEVYRYSTDRYRSPYLQQAVIRRQPDPLSGLCRHHLHRQKAAAGQALATLGDLLDSSATGTSETAALLARVETSAEHVEQAEAEDSADHPAASGTESGTEPRQEQHQEAAAGADSGEELDGQLEESLQQAAERLASLLPRDESQARKGYLVFNPLSFTRRVAVELPGLSGHPPAGGPVITSQHDERHQCAVVEVPALGYAWVPDGGGSAPSAGKREKPMAEEQTLRNEFFEVNVDPETGAIRSVRDWHHRGPLMSQRLAFRLPQPRLRPGEAWRDPDEDAQYAVMAADGVEITSSGPAVAEITSRGRLLDLDGGRLAGFEQTVRVMRGWPVIQIDVDLDVEEEPRADPWNSYYCARFAWADLGASVYRSANEGRFETSAKRIEAPHFVELRTEDTRSLILTGGLPYHRKMGHQVLDCLLAVKGESRRKFRLGIGIDVKHPMRAALDLMTPVAVVEDEKGPPRGAAASWLFHIDARSIVATHWEPLVEDGRPVGYRVRMLETEGRGGRARLRSFRPAESARTVSFQGETLSEPPIEADAILLDFTPHEWLEVEARWSAG